MKGTPFQHRLGAILAGTDSLTAEEVFMASGITSIETIEDDDDYDEWEDTKEKFEFGI